MNDSKNNPRQDPNLDSEKYLDRLLQDFLADPNDINANTAAEAESWDEIEEEAEEIIEGKAADSAAKSPIKTAPGERDDIFSDDLFLNEFLSSPDVKNVNNQDGQSQEDAAELDRFIREIQGETWSTENQEAEVPESGISNGATEELFVDQEFRDTFGDRSEFDQIFSQESDAPSPVEEFTEPFPVKASTPEAELPRRESSQEVPAGQKKRPKRNNTYGLFGIPHILSTGIWLILVIFIGAAVGGLIWDCATDVLAFGREDKAVTITITPSDDLDSLTDKLETTGLITKPRLFKLYAQLSNAMKKVGPGTYELNTLYDYHALVQMMSPTASNRVTVDVTIPEGYTCAQIFELLQKKGVCTVAELEDAAMNGELANYWFLEGVKRDSKNCLEGYLFPDTYKFYIGDSADRVLNKFLNNFDVRFTDIMAAKLEKLNETLAKMMAANGLAQDYIDQHKMTIREIVIIASMIEKETSGIEENYTISSVIYNRLTNPTEYPHLNIDATLVYITGHTELTQEDKKLDSPYNTYLHKGLIPGPISNPGRASLDAALDPEATQYYFYALDPKANRHHFSKTYEEHQAFLDSLKKNEE